ncbi:protein of unknown function [Chitinophaga costaii]|uniref:DUF4350 domain-containing protein n=1 Tax=Chitinophaga costaii TaxID=1335309 RepID=A0A1C4G0V0_9BACT|nr:DUF4350 domain-containing protein [Chitinophaga costaii]PUZ19944.1 DUF4350 domain-containing protein [Chitinophaga costaii]SCC61869.1 protein of unknown function [Chitinophaga costaii]
MKLKFIIIPVAILLVLFIILLILSKVGESPTTPLDMQQPGNVTFQYKDKNPYGGYVVYQWLGKLWKDQTPSVITRPFASAYNKNASMKSGGNVYVILAKQSFTDAADVRSMESFVMDGNTLVLGVCAPDTLLQQTFGFTISDSLPGLYNTAGLSRAEHFVSPRIDTPSFFYKGIMSENYFTSVDTAVTTILGENNINQPNFILVNKGQGHLLVLLDPVILTNYPLLHKDNSKMLEAVMNYAPEYETNNTLYWDEFYKLQTKPREGDFSEWQVLMRYPAMRWAFWLTILTALFYVLFESKRRQRIIPDIPPLTNTSVEFVTTLGKLYYEHHDNSNLAHKMVQHLLEYIRTRYNLNTQHLNEEFAETLARKSGYPSEQTRQLIQYIHQVRLEPQLSDLQLHNFYTATHQFYQNS